MRIADCPPRIVSLHVHQKTISVSFRFFSLALRCARVPRSACCAVFTFLLTVRKRKLSFKISREEILNLFLQQGSRCALSSRELSFAPGDYQKNRKLQTASLDRNDLYHQCLVSSSQIWPGRIYRRHSIVLDPIRIYSHHSPWQRVNNYFQSNQ